MSDKRDFRRRLLICRYKWICKTTEDHFGPTSTPIIHRSQSRTVFVAAAHPSSADRHVYLSFHNQQSKGKNTLAPRVHVVTRCISYKQAPPGTLVANTLRTKDKSIKQTRLLHTTHDQNTPRKKNKKERDQTFLRNVTVTTRSSPQEQRQPAAPLTAVDQI